LIYCNHHKISKSRNVKKYFAGVLI